MESANVSFSMGIYMNKIKFSEHAFNRCWDNQMTNFLCILNQNNRVIKQHHDFNHIISAKGVCSRPVN